jgi:arginine-tRNA-protein transferase
MKVFKSESLVDYSSYTFNYANYCLKESQEDIPAIYNQGFLPYSNDLKLQEEIFYMARSLRVDLDRFTSSSENRRVDRKIEVLNIAFEVLDYARFKRTETFKTFCLDYASQRFSDTISPERLDYIFASKSISKIFHFYIDSKSVGYVIAIAVGNTLHYWFAFFSLDFPKYSLGKWMMYSVINWAKENNYDYAYLGTCYGEKSLYKVRDFKGLSFWDGNSWNQDAKLLKLKCKTDTQAKADEFKQDTDLFLSRIAKN